MMAITIAIYGGLVGSHIVYGVPLSLWVHARNNENALYTESHLTIFVFNIVMWILQSGMGVYAMFRFIRGLNDGCGTSF